MYITDAPAACNISIPSPAVVFTATTTPADHLRSIRRPVSQAVLLSLATSLIMTRLDYSSAVLAGLPSHLLNRLQSVLNAEARLVLCVALASTTTSLICSGTCTGYGFRKEYSSDWPYWLSAVVTMHKAPSYLADELHWD